MFGVINVEEINIHELEENLLPEKSRKLFSVIGKDAFLKLICAMGGKAPYIPNDSVLEIRNRNDKILKDFNGNNYRHLAQKYDLTERWIREIISLGGITNNQSEIIKRNLESRNEKILADFNGNNYKELAIKYNLCDGHIRKIIKKILISRGELNANQSEINRHELEIRNKKIIEDFNGDNYKELAIKYNLSEGHIRRIIPKKFYSKERKK